MSNELFYVVNKLQDTNTQDEELSDYDYLKKAGYNAIIISESEKLAPALDEIDDEYYTEDFDNIVAFKDLSYAATVERAAPGRLQEHRDQS